MNLDHTTPRAAAPSYSFAERLEHWISSGAWPSGTTLPSLDELSRIFQDQDLAGIQEVLDGFLSRGVLLVDTESGKLSARGPLSARDGETVSTDLGLPFDNPADRAHARSEARNALLCQGVRILSGRATEDDLEHLRFALARTMNDQSMENFAAFDRELILRAGNGLMLRIYDRLSSLEMLDPSRRAGEPQAGDALTRAEILTAIGAGEAAAAVRFTQGLHPSSQRAE